MNANILKEIDGATQAHVANFVTVMLLLTEKGLVTHEEVQSAYVRAQQFVDQEWAAKREAARKQMEEEAKERGIAPNEIEDFLRENFGL